MNWLLRIFLIHLLVSGVSSVVSIEQPSTLTTSLGQNVTLPCTLKISSDHRLTSEPILYWELLTRGRLWPPLRKDQGRMQRPESGNWSILLKHVQWEDGGQYQCKLSLTTQNEKSFRVKGRGTELLLYDQILFQPSDLNASLLQCQVNVSKLSGFDLSISQSGQILKSTGRNSTSLHYVTLFQTVTLRSHRPYECKLHFNGELVTTSIFQDESGPSSPDEEYHRPWILYGGLILVQVVCLLVMTIAMFYQLLMERTICIITISCLSY
ncbi:uncharacterized protein LOC129411764 [Boleophthalmus pectinirostris]|uniref:uncharacterized protein LOC129411764 n=1 Tax=Boleophthalmus pectinirostris TaxID=150288 RepID=UPI00242EE8B2|nr:uncharacterized protein LOC129411764 [Boleophthalmus pectinirostris]